MKQQIEKIFTKENGKEYVGKYIQRGSDVFHLMTFCEGYFMCRCKGAMPFLLHISALNEGFHLGKYTFSSLKPKILK